MKIIRKLNSVQEYLTEINRHSGLRIIQIKDRDYVVGDTVHDIMRSKFHEFIIYYLDYNQIFTDYDCRNELQWIRFSGINQELAADFVSQYSDVAWRVPKVVIPELVQNIIFIPNLVHYDVDAYPGTDRYSQDLPKEALLELAKKSKSVIGTHGLEWDKLGQELSRLIKLI